MHCLLAQPPNSTLAAAELFFLVTHRVVHTHLIGLHSYYCFLFLSSLLSSWD